MCNHRRAVWEVGVHNDTKVASEDGNEIQPLFVWKLLVAYFVECRRVQIANEFLVWVLSEEFFDEGNVLIADEIILSGYARLRTDVGQRPE